MGDGLFAKKFFESQMFHTVWLFVTHCFWNLKNRTEELQKGKILEKLLPFSNFSNFWKFRKRFWYQLKRILSINYQNFWSYANFLLKIWHTNANFLLKIWHTIKKIWSMPLQCRQTRNIVWHISKVA